MAFVGDGFYKGGVCGHGAVCFDTCDDYLNDWLLADPRLLACVTSKELYDNMGNLQASEGKIKVGGKSPAKTKKSKQKAIKSKGSAAADAGCPSTTDSAKPVSLESTSGHAPPAPTNGSRLSSCPAGQQTTTYLVTDSWRHVKKLTINNDPTATTPSRESSSDSVFTDPLTPQGLAANKLDEMVVTITRENTIKEEDSNTNSTCASTTELDDITLVLDGEDEKNSSSQTMVPSSSVSPRPFTIVRHRKVELGPTKIVDTNLFAGGNNTGEIANK